MSKGLHQPLLVSLKAVEIQELDGDGLRRHARPHSLVNDPLVHRSEASFSEKVGVGESSCRHFKLREGEDVEVGAGERDGEVLWRERGL